MKKFPSEVSEQLKSYVYLRCHYFMSYSDFDFAV
jgi:hypothetical protein